MSTKLKLYLGRKIIESLPSIVNYSSVELQSIIQIGQKHSKNIEFKLSLNDLKKQTGIDNKKDILKISPDDIIKKISYINNSYNNNNIVFEIDKNLFIQDVLECCTIPDLYLNPEKIVVEFSSVNIAKPFHMGHLRSTIIGNFISNINADLNNKVIRINYLGDWGTQFGFVKIGVDELQYTPEKIKSDPLKILYNSYVYANKLAEKDGKILQRAKEEFNKLENGNVDNTYWKDYLEYSKSELKSIYQRLNIKFDEYHCESMYNASKITNIINDMKKQNVIIKQENGNYTCELNNHKVTLIKSDGSTLYLTRDIAAAIDRFKKYNFDKMFYVVDNSQSDHFNNLKQILYQMKIPWSNRIKHVKFGRVRGMSTRRGNVIFLKDILDECKDLMIKKQIKSPTTKVSLDNDMVSDILGVSCVIINDLKQRRQRDYEFSWDKVLQAQGDTGIKLQYTHCRLISLEKNCDISIATVVNPDLLNEPEAINLVVQMATFHEVLYKANEELESCILVNYLFNLCNQINKALKHLRIKGSPPDLASQRLLLFHKARKILHKGMTILGLQPLNEM